MESIKSMLRILSPMICLLALIVFGILGIFSVSHRKLALEAFDCVFRRITFRKCESRLDVRLKSKITGRILRKNKALGRFVYSNFEIISWVFTILLIASLAYTAFGLYNYAVYGNCNGDKGGFCIYDSISHETDTCTTTDAVVGSLITPGELPEWIPNVGNMSSDVRIIEFGCYSCPYTRSFEPDVVKLVSEYGDRVEFSFVALPDNHHLLSWEAAYAARCAAKLGMFWEYHNLLLSTDFKEESDFSDLATSIGLDAFAFNSCMADSSTIQDVEAQHEIGIGAGVYGTPTFFVNHRVVVGPESYKQLTRVVDAELKARKVS